MPLSRRFLLAGAGATVSSLALAAPVVASRPVETPAARVARLAEELSAALDAHEGGQFRAVVEPDSKSRCPVQFQSMRRPAPAGTFDIQRFLDTADPQAVADYHLNGLAEAMQRRHGGFWRGQINTGIRFAFVTQDSDQSSGVLIDFTHR